MTLLRRTTRLAEGWRASLPTRRVGASAGFETMRAAFDAPLPEHGTDPVRVVEELAAAAEPGLVAAPGPRYFGFVTGGSLPAALAADWLVSAWDQNSFSLVSSPATAAIEAAAARWALQALALPLDASVGFVTGATTGNLVGLGAARHHVLAQAGWDVEADGLAGAPPIRVLAGEDVHASVLKALRIAGLGAGRVERIAVDGEGAMRAGALAAALAAGAGGPAIVCAQAGNVSSGAFDPLREIASAAREHGAWVHVDGAFGLWAAASPRRRALVDGHAEADSWVLDAHKWLNVPYDGALAIVARPEVHRAAFGTSGSYLTGAAVADALAHVPEMSRRARGVPVYAALRSLGREGLAELIDRCCALAAGVAERMAAEPDVEVLNRVVLNQVLLRFSDDDAVTEAVGAAVREGGEAWLGGTTWQGRSALRVSVSGWMTGEADVERLAGALRRAHVAARAVPAGQAAP